MSSNKTTKWQKLHKKQFVRHLSKGIKVLMKCTGLGKKDDSKLLQTIFTATNVKHFIITVQNDKETCAPGAYNRHSEIKQNVEHCTKNEVFLLRISLVNVTKSAVSSRFGHIY